MGAHGFLGQARHDHTAGSGRSRLLATLIHSLAHAREAEDLSRRKGLLQGLDPRAKLVCLMALLVSAVALHRLMPLALIFVLAVALGVLSQVPLRRLAPLWLGVLLFTGVIALPALFLVPGTRLHGLPVTLEGLRAAAFLILRAATAATLALLLVLTTPWPHVLKALRCFGLPAVLIMLLTMTQRYIFALADTALRLHDGIASRHIGPLDARKQRRLTGAMAGTLFLTSLQMAEDVHLAMISRGWRGVPALLDDFRLRPRDGLACLVTVALIAALFGLDPR